VPTEQAHIIKAFRFELTRVQNPAVRARMVASLLNVDRRLASAVGEGLGIEVSEPLPRVVEHPATPEVTESPTLSLLARPGSVGVKTRRVGIVIADGVDGASTGHEALARAGAVPRYVGVKLGVVDQADGELLPVDITMEACPAVLFDALVLPNGIGTALANNGQLRRVRQGAVPALQTDHGPR
jgi:catalase